MSQPQPRNHLTNFENMKQDIFDTEVSIYNGVRDVYGTTCTLRSFLFDNRYVKEIARLRSLPTKEERNAIKRRLPQICVCGIFQPTRKADNLVKHSGLICLDVDRKDNQDIDNWTDLKQELAKLPQVAYISLSVSANGYFLILPLRYPEFHKQQFEQLKRDFSKMGITIDPACGDVSRLRCLSYDPHPYINPEAVPYEGYYVEPKPFINYQYSGGGVLDKVAKCCERIEANGIDITGDYQSWFTVGCALASLGEQGRQFFHACSCQNPKYNREETDKKFTNLLRTGKRIGVGSFFEICKDYGITFKSNY